MLTTIYKRNCCPKFLWFHMREKKKRQNFSIGIVSKFSQVKMQFVSRNLAKLKYSYLLSRGKRGIMHLSWRSFFTTLKCGILGVLKQLFEGKIEYMSGFLWFFFNWVTTCYNYCDKILAKLVLFSHRLSLKWNFLSLFWVLPIIIPSVLFCDVETQLSCVV